MRTLLLAVVLMGCGDDVATEPDAAPVLDAALEPYDYCEQLQTAPAPCYADPCELGGERVCGTERVCQQWDDELCSCYQCRVLYWCQCER